MGFFTWIIFGAIAGYVAGQLVGSERSGCLFNVIIGVVGAFLGGLITQFVTGQEIVWAFNIPSFIVAVLGAVLLLVVTGATRRNKKG